MYELLELRRIELLLIHTYLPHNPFCISRIHLYYSTFKTICQEVFYFSSLKSLDSDLYSSLLMSKQESQDCSIE